MHKSKQAKNVSVVWTLGVLWDTKACCICNAKQDTFPFPILDLFFDSRFHFPLFFPSKPGIALGKAYQTIPGWCSNGFPSRFSTVQASSRNITLGAQRCFLGHLFGTEKNSYRIYLVLKTTWFSFKVFSSPRVITIKEFITTKAQKCAHTKGDGVVCLFVEILGFHRWEGVLSPSLVLILTLYIVTLSLPRVILHCYVPQSSLCVKQ